MKQCKYVIEVYLSLSFCLSLPLSLSPSLSSFSPLSLPLPPSLSLPPSLPPSLLSLSLLSPLFLPPQSCDVYCCVCSLSPLSCCLIYLTMVDTIMPESVCDVGIHVSFINWQSCITRKLYFLKHNACSIYNVCVLWLSTANQTYGGQKVWK